MQIHVVRTEGLGDNTYVLTHDGIGVVVDPQRDFDRFESVLDDTGADLRFVLETHLHNDYVSGGRDLAQRGGGELVMPAGAAPVFRHTPAFHKEDLLAGGLAIRPLHTPGHTPEHMSYLILIDDLPVAVFSGGSLLVGSAGRSDLLGMERADTLARLQYRSVNRLARLPDEVGLFPTHGAGSFCTASGAGSLTSTIGAEKTANPVLAYPDEDAFVDGELSSLVPYPDYYQHMGPANVSGRPSIEDFEVPRLAREDLEALDGLVQVVDARPKPDFASGHLAGSLAIELRNDFGVWTGWVVDYHSPIVLVMNPDQSVEEAVRQLARIGIDDVRGVITDLATWDVDLESYELADVSRFSAAVRDGGQVLDVRAPNEWDLGTIPGSILEYAPDVVSVTPPDLKADAPVWVACETGYRASIAASALQQRGFEPVVLAGAGVTEVLRDLSKQQGTSTQGVSVSQL